MSHVKGRPHDHAHDDLVTSPKQPSMMAGITSITPSPEVARHWMKKYRTLIAASTSTLIATAVSHPIDTVKMQMQTDNKPFTLAVSNIYKAGGFREFYKGFLAPLGSVTLVRTVGFSVYQKAKYRFSSAIGKVTGMEEPLVTVNRPGSTPTPATLLCFGAAGALSGCLSTFIACPFELMKNTAQNSRLMAEKNPTRRNNTVGHHYEGKGTIKTAKEIIKQRGFFGLWCGLRLHMVRDTIGTSVYFMTYESLKQLLVKYQGESSPTPPGAVAMAGGACGVISWIITYHFDYVKNNYQRNLLEAAKGQTVAVPKINYADRTQLRGLTVTIFRSSLTNAVLFSCFELIKKKINNLPDPDGVD